MYSFPKFFLSSVKPHDKKDGSGSYNWGTPQDDINAARYFELFF